MRYREVDIPFTGPLNERGNAKVLPFGTFARLENVRREEDGALVKRPGYTALSRYDLSNTTQLSGTRRLFEHQGQPVAIDSAYGVQAWVIGSSRWRSHASKSTALKGPRLATYALSSVDGRYAEPHVYQPTIATNSGYTVLAYVADRGGTDALQVHVRDSSGVVIESVELDTAVVGAPVAVAAGARVYLTWRAGTTLYRSWFNTADPAGGWTTPQAFTTAASGHDASPLEGSTDILLIDWGTTTIKIRRLDSTFTSVYGPVTVVTGTTIVDAAVCGHASGRIYVAYNDNGTSYLQTYDATLAAPAGPVTITTATGNGKAFGMAMAGSSKALLVSGDNSAFEAHVGCYSDTTLDTLVYLPVTRAMTRTYWDGARFYFVGLHGGNYKLLSGATGLGDVTASEERWIHVESVFGNGEVSQNSLVHPFTVALDSAGKLLAPAEYSSSIGGNDSIRVATFAQSDEIATVSVGESTIVANGIQQAYDGRQLTELGFFNPPYVSVVASTSSGTLPAGTYGVSVVYEWTDGRGRRHQSEPSAPVSKTLAGAGKLDITIQPEPFHMKGSGVVSADTELRAEVAPLIAVVYITTASGTIYYRAYQSANLFPEVSRIAAVTHTISSSVLNLTTYEKLYSLSRGELANVQAQSSRIVTRWRDRLACAPAEHPAQVWFSKTFSPADPPAYNDTLRVVVADDVTALIEQDGRLVIFTASSVYTLDGDGPNNAGLGSFAAPQLLSTEIGCTNSRSVVATPIGVFFQSQAGIFVLPRGGGSPEPIGDVVRDSVSSETIRAAVHLPARYEVRFVLSQTLLVYDYRARSWFVDTNVYPQSSFSSAIAIGNTFYLADKTSGVVLQDNGPSVRTDDGNWITPIVETGDIRLAGLNGYQRCRSLSMLGESDAAHTLKVEASHDGGVTWPESNSFAVTATGTVQHRYLFAQRRTRAPRLRFSVLQNGAATTLGEKLLGLTLAIAAEKGGFRPTSGERA